MKSLLQENKKTFALATPIIAGQLSQMLIGLVDTLMIGRVGTVELATAAFVNVLFHLAFVIAIGLFSAVSIQVSHAFGQSRNDRVAESFRHSFLVSIAAAVVLAGFLFALIPRLGWFRQPEAVTALTPTYLVWIALSLIPMVPAMTIKSFAEALNRPWSVLWIMLGGVALNVLFNYMFIFGNFGVPALGLAGAGIATLLARCAALAGLWLYLRHSDTLSACLPTRWLGRLDYREIIDLLKIAGPIAGQISMEFGAFAVGALLIGQFGPAALAAHQVTLTCAATSFMLPLGLSMALTIRIGHCIGAGRLVDCRRIFLAAQGCGLLMMGACALLFFTAGDWLAAGFTEDAAVVTIATRMFAVAAFFQLFDGAQILANGALRGMRDVYFPTLLIFVSFWLIALPLGSLLAFTTRLQATGVWIGLASGLAVAAVILSWRVGYCLRQAKTSV